jgi:hypothetical protein
MFFIMWFSSKRECPRSRSRKIGSVINQFLRLSTITVKINFMMDNRLGFRVQGSKVLGSGFSGSGFSPTADLKSGQLDRKKSF